MTPISCFVIHECWGDFTIGLSWHIVKATAAAVEYEVYFLGSTPRVIIGSRMPRNPISKSGPGFVRWSIQFDRLVNMITNFVSSIDYHFP